MLGKNFRPWGELNWLFSKFSPIKWNLIGCISFEDRCIGFHRVLSKYSIDKNLLFSININKDEIDAKKKQDAQNINKQYFLSSGVKSSHIIDVDLLGSVDYFLTIVKEFINKSNGNIILDITSFPKRFFFPILKRLINDASLLNLVVTYTKPEEYAKSDLSWDPSDWNHLPSFMSNDFRESKIDLAIIAVGFVPLGLPKLLIGNYIDAEVKLLFPHPPGPPHYQRNWEFVRKIVDSYPRVSLNEMPRVHATDTSDSFDKLCHLTNNGKYKSLLAPYGPKPVSLSMALFAIEKGIPVYYTQPNVYAFDYSTGTKETFGYWIVKSGKSLYKVPT